MGENEGVRAWNLGFPDTRETLGKIGGEAREQSAFRRAKITGCVCVYL